MQQLILSHKTALSALRQIRIGNKDYMFSPKIEENNRLDLLVFKKVHVHSNKKYIYHLHSNKLPKNSLVKINNSIYSVSPELLIIQLSGILSYHQLFLLILELCGTYSICPSSQILYSSLEPLTNIANIKHYLNRYEKTNPKFPGIRNLKDVLKYAQNNSASPMEARIYIKLCGPPSKGFYGCKNLQLNKPVELSHDAKLISGQQLIIPDLSNPSKKVAIEYDSSQFHENDLQGQKDKRRRDALIADGWKTFTLVPAQVNEVEAFDIFAKNILKALGQDNRMRIKDFEIKRNRYFEILR